LADYRAHESSDVVAVMLSIWFRRRDQLAPVEGAREDLERFVDSLRGMSDKEVGGVVAFAAIARVALRKSGLLPDELLQITSAKKQANAQLAVAQVVSRYRAERRFAEATGVMVWLHTLRALSTPKVRHLGLEMWRQLQRGPLHALVVLQDMGVPSMSDVTMECSRIPHDLFPDDGPG
jgi:hypothetical protein